MIEQTTTKSKRRYDRQLSKPSNENEEATGQEASDASVPPTQETKIETVIALLRRRDGATLEDLTNATGWLPHTARAALTGLRKKGHAIERTKIDSVSRYAIMVGS